LKDSPLERPTAEEVLTWLHSSEGPLGTKKRWPLLEGVGSEPPESALREERSRRWYDSSGGGGAEEEVAMLRQRVAALETQLKDKDLRLIAQDERIQELESKYMLQN